MAEDRAARALRLAHPIIEEIGAKSGTPGLAIGLIASDGTVQDQYHGFRDVASKAAPNAETLFDIASLTKGFTSTAVACHVEEGKVHRNDRIHDYLVDLRMHPSCNAEIQDLLNHRSGLARSDVLYTGSESRLLLTKAQGGAVLSHLDMPYGAKEHCIRDLSVFYSAMLRKPAAIDPSVVSNDTPVTSNGTTPIPDDRSGLNPIPENIQTIFESKIRIPTASGSAATLVCLTRTPTIGDLDNAPLVLHHYGGHRGFSSTVYLMPELGCAIVVLGNARAHCDATAWATQVVLEAYLYREVRTDFVPYVLEAASRRRSVMDRVQAALDEERAELGDASNPPLLNDLPQYTGTFWHVSRQFCIVVAVEQGGQLTMALQGWENEKYVLVITTSTRSPHWFYKIEFVESKEDELIVAIRWRIDDTKP
ncbi:beta-lactamase/transpeptidase-like protein [Podospora didyma]|uniref:Beta-lactamase/transpeptidase-like protein n=1 Tax=Podospora didyma TaxID=330526 RepID=A0AAE0K9W9_9PEZI|nr:beta-lactamase/transpeptidase-like protein [Podospora didyma]